MARPHLKAGQLALRKGRWSAPGNTYIVTTTTHRRASHFSGWEAARMMSACIARRSLWSPHADLLCWVLMPDHWHGLVRLTHGTSLGDVIGAAKGRSAHTLRELVGKRIWANGFHDRALRWDDDLVAAARYIVSNPVRAGMVARVGDYPYWDAVWLD